MVLNYLYALLLANNENLDSSGFFLNAQILLYISHVRHVHCTLTGDQYTCNVVHVCARVVYKFLGIIVQCCYYCISLCQGFIVC